MVFQKGIGYWTGKKRKPFSKKWRINMGKAHKGKPGYWLGKRNKKNTGENNPGWKGNKVSVAVLHKWVRRFLGSPNSCEHCKRTDKKKYEWANKDHKYRRNLKDWLRLCTPCHRKWDIENNNWSEKRLSFVIKDNKKFYIKDLQKITGFNLKTIALRIYRGWNFDQITFLIPKRGNNQNLRTPIITD